MKYFLCITCCGTLMLSGVLFGVNAYTSETVSSSKLADAIIYSDSKEPFVDPKNALKETFGEELADEILNAGSDDLILFDLVNGDVEVVHCSPEYSAVENTEAFIPEGLDVVEPFAVKRMPCSGHGGL